AIFGAGRDALRVSSGASRHTEAALEARSLIDRLGTDIPLRPGEIDGKTESGRAYRITMTPVSGSARATLFLYHVVAELRNAPGDRAPVVRSETLKTQGPRT